MLITNIAFLFCQSWDRCCLIKVLSWVSNSLIMCKYVFSVVVMLAWPNLFETPAIETPAYKSKDAWVWRRPWIEISGIPALMHLLLRKLLTVEL